MQQLLYVNDKVLLRGPATERHCFVTTTQIEPLASRKHLPKYADEFAFHWNTRSLSDGSRIVEAIELTEGKQLTYKSVVV